MSYYDSSSRAGSAGPSSRSGFLLRLESLGPTESRAGDSVDMRSTTAGMDIDDNDTVHGGEQELDGIFHPSLLQPSPDESELDDLRRLARVWVRERGTLAILMWEGEVVDSLLDKLEQQVSLVMGVINGEGR